MKLLASALLLAAATTGCIASGGTEGDSSEQDVSTTTYVDILDFQNTDQGQWYDTIHKLNAEFDAVCGDTFCEGDYSNIVPLTFGCSVSSKAGSVRDCAWTFAAGQADVDTRTAALLVDAPTFICPVKTKTTAKTLSALLANSDDAIHVALPGGFGSIYDQLGDCFEHPIGATPGTFATTGTESYVAASQYYTSNAGYARWSSLTAALKLAFDNVCGDTFCGSDFSDLQAMKFECAVTKSTGNVKSCTWVFGGSYHTVPEHGGLLDETAKTWKCTVAMKGTLSKLIDTYTAAGTGDVLRRPLPGMMTSIYDAIGDCLP